MDSITAVRLSKRQIECLRGVAEHLDSQQIAHRLGISPHTVDGHIAAAIKVLGAQSRRDAVKRLADQGGQSLTGGFPLVDYSTDKPSIPSQPAIVREERSIFDADALATVTEAQNDNVKPNPLRMIVLIAALAAAMVTLLLAMDPLVQSASRLANTIHPIRTSS